MRPYIISPDITTLHQFIVVSFLPQTNPSGNEDEAGSLESSGLRKAISISAAVALVLAGVLAM